MISSLRRMALTAFLVFILAACGSNSAATDEAPQPAATDAAGLEDQPAEELPDYGGAPVPASDAKTFTIIAEESEARFIVKEILSGNEKTVIGITTAVEGTITVDYQNPGGVSMSVIQIDLSKLETDNSFRNRAIHSAILKTGDEDFRYAVFEAAGFSGLPESVVIGQAFDFQISGNLTLHGVTQQVIFEAIVTPVSETRLEGLAFLLVRYEDYEVSILRLPDQVASVEDTAILELEFAAETQ